MELELDTYSGIVTEMGNTANIMVNAKHPDTKAIASKQQAISQQMRNLQKLASARQQRLVESMCRHEYFSESAELDTWVREQAAAATSEDYGQDYEHLLVCGTSMLNCFVYSKHIMKSYSVIMINDFNKLCTC